MFLGGKTGYTNLLHLIRDERPKLYDLIIELCLDRLFRTQKYVNTFLMPSKELVDSLVDRVDKNEDFAVIEEIRSLMLNGHVPKSALKSGATIGTMRSGFVLEDPAAVGKELKPSSLTILTREKKAEVTTVYDYTGKTVPAIVRGKSGGLVLVGSISGGHISTGDREIVTAITASLVHENKGRETTEKFRHAVASLICYLQKEDPTRYKRVKFYLASNPILSWHFLTMGGSSNALIKASELQSLEKELSKSLNPMQILIEAESAGYTMNSELLTDIKKHRVVLVENRDRTNLIKSIHKSYTEFCSSAQGHSIDDILGRNVNLKILLDELRFRYDGAVDDWLDVDDALAALKVVHWEAPEKSMVVCNEEVYNCLLKNAEAYNSGPVKFVKTVYFMSIPLNEATYAKLHTSTKAAGCIQGGNPATISNVIFAGGAARIPSSNSDVALASFVRVLSKAQRLALRDML